MAVAEQAATDAAREAAEAADLVAALKERVRGGDTTITPDHIADAERVADFAQLRREAADRAHATAQAEGTARARREHAEQITAAITSGALDVAPVAAAYQQMRAAMAAFVDAANTYNAGWQQAHDDITIRVPNRGQPGPDLADFGVRVYGRLSDPLTHPRVAAGDTWRYRLLTAAHIARAAVDAEKSISPQYGEQLRHRLDGVAGAATREQPALDAPGEAKQAETPR
ncbi:hypothetical protein [Actinomadura nitritigenes]|uniref:hypothetical protein n=1 Tax=Actinomadura nitritigenes TaxID=134602 RepID=UPI003D91E0DB